MKALKFWALLGGFAVATNCAATGAFANETKTGASEPAPYQELNANSSSRGIRLDELFKCFDQKAAVSSTKTVKPAATTAIKPQTSGKSAVRPVKHAVVASNKQSGKSKPAIQTAIYTKTDSGNQTQLAVSSGAHNSSSTVISGWLDKPGTLPNYKSGDRMVVKLSAASDCNVLVFDYDSKGTLTQLFPNDFETSGTLKAGQTVEIGGAESKYTLDISGKGIERIFVYAYPLSEQPITVAMTPISRTPFRSVDITPDQYHKLVASSRTYFENPSHDRGVKITPKAGSQAVSTSTMETDKQPNKLELTFQIDK